MAWKQKMVKKPGKQPEWVTKRKNVESTREEHGLPLIFHQILLVSLITESWIRKVQLLIDYHAFKCWPIKVCLFQLMVVDC